jgi:plastocyanin
MLPVVRLFVFVVTAVLIAGCSGGSSPAAPTPPPSAGTPTPPATPTLAIPTVTITSTGMTPLEITIDVGQRVTFVNNDTRAHDLVGGIDPNNPDCPEITQAGFLTPGQSRDTGIFTTARRCEYHDHTMLSVPAFQGRIIIR